MLLVKLADPPPSFVLVVNDSVGVGDVDQHTPFAMSAPPPSAEMVPPETAEVLVTKEAVTVSIVGFATGVVVNVTASP
jgi:hypothetical protein